MIAAKLKRILPAPALSIALACTGFIIVGSLGPWGQVPRFTGDVFWVKGTAAAGMIPLVADGTLTLVFAAAAAVLVLWRLGSKRSGGFALLTAIIVLALVGVVGLVNWSSAGNIPAADPTLFFAANVEVSWGLVLVTVSAWIGSASLAVQLWWDEIR